MLMHLEIYLEVLILKLSNLKYDRESALKHVHDVRQ